MGTLKRVIITTWSVRTPCRRLGSIISGIPGHAIEDVKISNIQIQHQGGGTKENAAIQPPEDEAKYPEPGMFGPMPSHGFYIRHVDGIELSNIEILPAKDDLRPAFVLDNVHGAEFFRVKTPRGEGAPLFELHNVTDFSVHFCQSVPDTTLDRVESQAI